MHLVVVAKERASCLSCCRLRCSGSQAGTPDSLLIVASEDSRDWQRARVDGARSRQGEDTKALGAWASGGRAHTTWHDLTWFGLDIDGSPAAETEFAGAR